MSRPVYTASTTIWIDQGESGRGGMGPLAGPGIYDPEAWLNLIRSFAVLDTVVSDLHLNIRFTPPVDPVVTSKFELGPGFRPGGYKLRMDSLGRGYTLLGREDVPMESGVLGDSIGLKLGFRWAPPAGSFAAKQVVQFGVSPIRTAAVGLSQRIQPRIDEKGTVMTVSLEDGDPVLLAHILNSVSQRFSVVATNLKRQRLLALTQILAGQVEYARKSLAAAEGALEAFEVRTITLPDRAPAAAAPRSGGTDNSSADPLFSNYFQMQLEAAAIRQDRSELRRVLSAPADSGLSVAGFEGISAVQKSAVLSQTLQELNKKRADLRALRSTFADAHPQVQRARADIAALERTTIPNLVRNVDSELALRADYLANQMNARATNLREIPQRSLQGARLQRNLALATALFSQLEQSYQSAKIAEASSSVGDVRTLDVAVPPQYPSKDTKQRILLLALVGSLGLGGAGAMLLDRLDGKFRYPDQVSKEMGLTILGAIPHNRSKAVDEMERGSDNAPLLESLRAIRLNLVYAYGAAGPMVFTVTSPGRAEGKTFVTAQLARVFAESGQRTLVIEGDLRKGALHRRLTVSRRPGLSDYLRGDAAVDQILQKTKFPQLHVITGGTRFHDAPELLGTQAMAQLLASLRSRYDVIICDSPPLGAGIDPLVLGTATGNMLLVLRTGVSQREFTEGKLEVISRLPIRMLGAVLNDVPKDAVFGYYSYYLPGYETSDEGRLALPAAKSAV